MFKNINIMLMLLVFGSAASAQKQFIVRGQINKSQSGWIRLTYFNMGKNVVDSVQFKNGSFEFKGLIEAPADATLEINPIYGRPTYEERMRQDMREFYLEGRETLIKSDSGLKAATITAGKQQKYFEESEAAELAVARQMWALNDLGEKYRTENNQTGLDSLRIRSVTIIKDKEKLDSVFIATHPDSFVAFHKLRFAEVLSKYSDATIATLFGRFSPEIRNSQLGKVFAAKIETAKTLKKGMPAPGINLPDATGKMVSLSTLKGKYVLLCFSPSPDTRNLARIFGQMVGKNFSIYSVTITNNMDLWNSMQHSASSQWTSVVDFNKIDSPTGTLISPTAKAYNLTFALNYCFLIDPAGMIVMERTVMDPALFSKIQDAIK
ncbi:DUF4369 domain-containing protein [Pedobacter sp. MC2016-14]|uniref:DUF4369 domain-containing protein n=1 Tax=Pedobacter sp. MC2016-14 TaxID=2897327 RepID=UPI001E2854F4|nr:DUF4369 domain-containing protein [Pedobacter sp. MC2016-14]MCD0488627.1 DUF4369 domain-containing protein [Pedobacter sp. MC2016-14]